jgi:hypothetical protein
MAAGVPVEPPAPTIAVKAITGRPSNTSPRYDWRALATITVRDVATGGAMANVKVSGSFAPGGLGSCVTGSLGICTITSATIRYTYPSTVFTLGNLAGYGMAYDSSQNAASQIVIQHR